MKKSIAEWTFFLIFDSYNKHKQTMENKDFFSTRTRPNPGWKEALQKEKERWEEYEEYIQKNEQEKK